MRLLLLAACLLACERGLPANTGLPAAGSSAPPSAAPAPAADVPSLTAAQVEDADIQVDGKPLEPAWQRCGSTGDLVSPMGGGKEPASRVQGQARVCWSTTHLYILVTVRDAQPASPFGRDAVDPHLWEQSSAVEVMLQPGPGGDNKVYYELQVDVHEAVWDTWFDDYNRPITAGANGQRIYGHQEWNAGLKRAVTVDATAGSYTVEMALPWSAVQSGRAAAPPAPQDVWRMNLYTFKDGQRDALAWSPLLGRGNFHFAPRFGRVTFAAKN